MKLTDKYVRYEALNVLNQQVPSSSFLDYWKNVKKIPAALEEYAYEIFGREAITLNYLCELYCARSASFLIPFIVKKSLKEECALYLEDDALCIFVNNKLTTIPLEKQLWQEQSDQKELLNERTSSLNFNS